MARQALPPKHSNAVHITKLQQSHFNKSTCLLSVEDLPNPLIVTLLNVTLSKIQ